MMGVGSQ